MARCLEGGDGASRMFEAVVEKNIETDRLACDCDDMIVDNVRHCGDPDRERGCQPQGLAQFSQGDGQRERAVIVSPWQQLQLLERGLQIGRRAGHADEAIVHAIALADVDAGMLFQCEQPARH